MDAPDATGPDRRASPRGLPSSRPRCHRGAAAPRTTSFWRSALPRPLGGGTPTGRRCAHQRPPAAGGVPLPPIVPLTPRSSSRRLRAPPATAGRYSPSLSTLPRPFGSLARAVGAELRAGRPRKERPPGKWTPNGLEFPPVRLDLPADEAKTSPAGDWRRGEPPRPQGVGGGSGAEPRVTPPSRTCRARATPASHGQPRAACTAFTPTIPNQATTRPGRSALTTAIAESGTARIIEMIPKPKALP